METRFDSRQIRAWVLVVIWASFVWALGTDGLSASQTSRFLRPLLEWIYPDLSAYQLYKILLSIRKSAHVIEYALLGFLTLHAILLGKRPSLIVSAGLALAFIISFSTADETRQGFSKARTGSAFDVLLDSAGGASAIGLLIFLQLRSPTPHSLVHPAPRQNRP